MKTYAKRPYSIAQYSMMRGTIDYSNASQFNLFESGYSFLTVISRPKYIEKLADSDPEVEKSLNLFCYILENEFRGLDGIEDVTAENLEYTDNINTMYTIGKVTQQSAAEVSMTFTERSGGAMTAFIDYFLRGIKDPRTQAKTYHGLIKNGALAAGFENEVFNLLYIVTDNTLLAVEKAYLLVNAWPNKAPTGELYNSTKGEIDKKEITVTFNCFVIDGEEVNKRALKMLAYINEKGAVANASVVNGSTNYAQEAAKGVSATAAYPVVASSQDYNYSIYENVDNVYKN